MQRFLRLLQTGITNYVSTQPQKPNLLHLHRQFTLTYSSASSKPVEDTTTPKPPQPPSEDQEKMKKLILMEMELLKQSGEFFIPEKITEEDMKELLTLNSALSRRKYFKYLKKIEINQEKTKIKKEKKAAELAEKVAMDKANPHIVYGLRNNTIFLYVRDSTMVKFHNNNLAHAVLYGQKLVFDFDFTQHMKTRELKNCVDQLQECYGFNKIEKEPFYLHFCNLKSDDGFRERLNLAIPPLTKPHPLVNVTEKSYLELFPKEDLVYLTPDCRNDLVRYSHDDVYIIGALVDKGPSKPLTLAKAKREGLRMARLPLERHLDWGLGHKSLTLDQMLKILLKMKDTSDWKTAFEHVPKRKLRVNDEQEQLVSRKRYNR